MDWARCADCRTPNKAGPALSGSTRGFNLSMFEDVMVCGCVRDL